MKKIFVTIVVVFAMFVAAAQSHSQTLDIKTPISEKSQLFPLKIGTTYWALNRGAAIWEFGEDYAVWIKNYRKTTNGTVVNVSVLVAITNTDTGFKKESLGERIVTFSFSTSAPKTFTTDDETTRFIRSQLERYGEIAVLEGQIGGRAISDAIFEMLNNLPNRRY